MAIKAAQAAAQATAAIKGNEQMDRNGGGPQCRGRTSMGETAMIVEPQGRVNLIYVWSYRFRHKNAVAQVSDTWGKDGQQPRDATIWRPNSFLWATLAFESIEIRDIPFIAAALSQSVKGWCGAGNDNRPDDALRGGDGGGAVCALWIRR